MVLSPNPSQSSWQRIELPTSVRVHTLRSVLTKIEFFPRTPPGFILAFNPKHGWFDPVAVAMLAAWGDYWTSRSIPVQCENVGARGVRYLHRMGLFNVVHADGLSPMAAHEGAGRFVELRSIEDQPTLSKFIGDIASIIRAKHLIEIVQYVVAELTRNVLEHARAKAFVCAQYYPVPKRVSIGIADCGVGVRASLRRFWPTDDDTTAVLTALRPFVSGASRNLYGAPDNAGLGLFYARGLAKYSREYFLMYSGTGAYRQKKASKAESPERHPSRERADVWGDLFNWQGTVVSIDIRGTERSFAAVKAAIGDVAGTDRALEDRVANHIRFT